jgi:phage shock protein A
MAYTEIVILSTKSRDAARDALRELKRLHRDGWVDITCYALVDEDGKGGLHIREASDCAEALRLSDSNGLAGALMESLARATDGGLQPGDFALLVTVDERYAERVAAEFEKRGRTLRRPLGNGECEAMLRGSIEEIRSKMAWLTDLLEHESERMGRAYGDEKERFETGIRAGRAELAAEREHLQVRLLALRAELETRLLENARKAGKGLAGGSSEELELEIAEINEDLALSILDHLDALAAHAAELREKASRSAAGAGEIEEQLEELELHMRKYRADLTSTLAASASLSRNCTERRQTGGSPPNAGAEAALEHHMKKLEQRHALLKADIEHVQREDSRAWHDLTSDTRQNWRGQRETLDEVPSEH